jgi:TPR repeat protein
MYFIGLSYLHGSGVNQDDEEAQNYFWQGAENGDIDSFFMIGFTHEMGIGVKKNISEAIMWYKKAAEKGHQEAIERLHVINVEKVAVGTTLPDGPPHRSQRAELPHWAPTSGVWRKSAGLDEDAIFWALGSMLPQ